MGEHVFIFVRFCTCFLLLLFRCQHRSDVHVALRIKMIAKAHFLGGCGGGGGTFPPFLPRNSKTNCVLFICPAQGHEIIDHDIKIKSSVNTTNA